MGFQQRTISINAHWPFERDAHFAQASAPNLAEAWTYSANRIRDLQHAVEDCLPEFVACVAISGSLARMEGHSESDIDLIVVIDDRLVDVSDADAAVTFGAVWDRLDALGAVRPKPGGIFSECARRQDLTDITARGRIDENITTFGHRIQLLMDAQPVTAPQVFSELRRDILNWYTEDRLAPQFGEAGPLHWLWQDVQRYWRSLRARTCWLDADNTSKSLLLNVKLRSSRLTLVFAFLQAIASAQQSASSKVIPFLLESLCNTPLERLFPDNTDVSRCGLTAYNAIWSFLRDHATSDVREISPEVGIHLETLAQSIADRITSVAGRKLHPWLM